MGFQLAACDMLILDANDTATEPQFLQPVTLYGEEHSRHSPLDVAW
jgi:hypothetical protein